MTKCSCNSSDITKITRSHLCWDCAIEDHWFENLYDNNPEYYTKWYNEKGKNMKFEFEVHDKPVNGKFKHGILIKIGTRIGKAPSPSSLKKFWDEENKLAEDY
jgi:hypothetical protein